MNRLDRIAVQIIERPWPDRDRFADEDEFDEANHEASEQYFAIGHGDYDEETGIDSPYIVWVWRNNRIEVSEESEWDEGRGEHVGATHGWQWGHDRIEGLYKGRYETETGRCSVVVPDRQKMRPLPASLVQQLEQVFRPLTQIFVFR